jgi:hypothetical protein
VGCGAARGGPSFTTRRRALLRHRHQLLAIEAGRRELAEAKLESRAPNLLVSDRFEVGRFDTTFDCAIAVSVFTHLPMNHIVRCLIEVRKVLRPAGAFYASYFEAPSTAYLAPLPHSRGGIVTSYDADPYHYAFDEVRWMAGTANLEVELIGEWGHPRDQRCCASVGRLTLPRGALLPPAPRPPHSRAMPRPASAALRRPPCRIPTRIPRSSVPRRGLLTAVPCPDRASAACVDSPGRTPRAFRAGPLLPVSRRYAFATCASASGDRV